jgi:hypothetical protein
MAAAQEKPLERIELEYEVACLIIEGLTTNFGIEEAMDIAERILAHPDISKAFTIRNAWLADQMPDLPQERVGEIIRGMRIDLTRNARRDTDRSGEAGQTA